MDSCTTACLTTGRRLSLTLSLMQLIGIRSTTASYSLKHNLLVDIEKLFNTSCFKLLRSDAAFKKGINRYPISIL